VKNRLLLQFVFSLRVLTSKEKIRKEELGGRKRKGGEIKCGSNCLLSSPIVEAGGRKNRKEEEKRE